MKKVAPVFISIIFLAASFAASAAEEKKDVLKNMLEGAISPIDTILGPATELEKIVITPSRIKEKLGATSCSVSVVESADFDRQKIDMVHDALSDQAGLDVVQRGAYQGQTSLFTRGGNSNMTLIYVDGVKAYDPISPNGMYDLAFLTLDNVDRIEVLRGPQSAMYGSDAMAGVINITSKKAEKPYVTAYFDAGQQYTTRESVEVGSASNGFHYSLSFSQLNTKGISQFEMKNDNQEHDPLSRTAVAGRVDYDIGESASVGATMRYTNARYEYDDVVSGQKDDDNSVGRYREAFVTLFGECTIFEYWKQTIRLGWMEMIRQNFDDDPPATDYVSNKFSGRYFKLDYNSIFPVLDFDTVVVGYEYTEEIGDNYKDYGPAGGGVYDMPKAFSHENDLYVENRINVTDRLTSTQGIRISHHTKAGTFSTYRFDGSYLLATGTKIRGLIGTGYRAPSLFQLYTPRDPYMGAGGNASLKPEKSFSYEYGLDQYLFGDKVILGVTYFSAIYRDLIDAVETAPWVYDDYRNVGKATAHGIEISAKAKPYKGMTVTGGFTYQKTKNLQTDRELLLRPAHKFFIEYAWEVTDKFRVDTLVRYNGPNIDTDTKLSKIKEYTVVSFVAEYDITKNISVHCKIINLFNKHYEEAIGYSTLPFSAYGGVKAKF